MDKSILRQRAKNLRKQSTDTERHLWYNFRANRLGYQFKRQVPIGTDIVDFVCLEKLLIVELDGDQHFNNQQYDMERTVWLKERGFKVLRFWNADATAYCRQILIIAASHGILMYFYDRPMPFVISIFFLILSVGSNIPFFRPIIVSIVNAFPMTIF
ncbi:TPA: DUF559 domain-containing protein [Legionella pneumophila]|nr:DUF559 domain-containing protein [Legionella pneumophila]HAT8182667.1 DUF559 domain-containing protein [Legionella pneumophila]